MGDRGLLEVTNLKVAYEGAGLGIEDVSLQVAEGSVVALLGSNGAGKSTTLRAVSGYLPSDVARIRSGRVVFKGRSLGTMPPHRRVALGMSSVPERDKVFRSLTVEENLRICSRQRNGGRRPVEILRSVYDLFPALEQRRPVAAGYLSGGERQMLGIGRALMADPSLLLADEVSLGIAPGLVTQLLDALRRINREWGVTILLVEQNAAAALRVADRVAVLENGRVSQEGSPDDLLRQRDFAAHYLGVGGRTA